MATISNRSPEVYVEYTARGQRTRKLFTDPYAARSFYCAKLKAGAEPSVKKVETTDTLSANK